MVPWDEFLVKQKRAGMHHRHLGVRLNDATVNQYQLSAVDLRIAVKGPPDPM